MAVFDLPINSSVQLSDLPPGSSRILKNVGNYPIYYGTQYVSAANNTGVILPGKTVTLKGSWYVISPTGQGSLDDEPTTDTVGSWGAGAVEKTSPGTYGRQSTINTPGLRDVVSLNDPEFGAVADRIELADAQTLTAGFNANIPSAKAVYSPTGKFATAVPGQIITISGAGVAADDLRTTITAVADANHITTNTACSTAVTNSWASFGTDNGAAVSKVDGIVNQYGAMRIWAMGGGYMSTQSFNITSSNVKLDLRATVWDYSQSVAINSVRYGIFAQGWVGASSNSTAPQTFLAVDALAGQMQARVNSTAGLVAGTDVILACDAPRANLTSAMLVGDMAFTVTKIAGQAAFSAKGIGVVDGERIAWSSWVDNGNGTITFTVRAAPNGRGLMGLEFGVAAGHLIGATFYEDGDARFLCRANKSTQDKGEYKRISYVDATLNIIYFDEPLDDTYQVSNQASIRFTTGMVSDLHIEAGIILMSPHQTPVPNIAEEVIHLQYVKDFVINTTRVVNGDGTTGNGYGLRMRSCLRGQIRGVRGEVAPSAFDESKVNYTIACEGCCQYLMISGAITNRGMCVSFAQLNAGQGMWGIPRFCNVTGCIADNSYTKEYQQHAGFQVEGQGRHISFTGCHVDGCSEGFYLQGSEITVTGGSVRNWTHSGVNTPSNAYRITGVEVNGLVIGQRAWGAGYTTLTADLPIASGNGATVAVTSTIRYFAGNTDNQSRTGVFAVMKETAGVPTIQELISYKATDPTHFTIQARQVNGTPLGGPGGGTFLASDNTLKIVQYAQATYAVCPIQLEFDSCIWPQGFHKDGRAQVVTTLSANMAAGDTTMTLPAGLTLPATNGLLQIEPQQLTGVTGEDYATEVVYYSAYNSGTGAVTGVIRGVNGTIVPGLLGVAVQGSANSHDAGVFVATYLPGVSNYRIHDCPIEMDFDYYSVFVKGYCAAENVKINDLHINNTQPNVIFSNFAVRSETPGVIYRDNDITGYANGMQFYGYKTKAFGNTVICLWQQASGVAFQMRGANQKVIRNTVEQAFQGVQVQNANCTGAVAVYNTIDVGASNSANAIVGALSDSITTPNTIVGVNSAGLSWGPSDNGWLTWNFDPENASSSQTLSAAGTAHVISLKCNAGLVTNIHMQVVTAGVTLTAGQCFAALFQNGTLLGTSADQSGSWNAAGFKTMALNGGAGVNVAAGTCQVYLWYNGTTSPAFLRGDNHSELNAGQNGSTKPYRWATADTLLTTTAPNNMGAQVAGGGTSSGYWAALS